MRALDEGLRVDWSWEGGRGREDDSERLDEEKGGREEGIRSMVYIIETVDEVVVIVVVVSCISCGD